MTVKLKKLYGKSFLRFTLQMILTHPYGTFSHSQIYSEEREKGKQKGSLRKAGIDRRRRCQRQEGGSWEVATWSASMRTRVRSPRSYLKGQGLVALICNLSVVGRGTENREADSSQLISDRPCPKNKKQNKTRRTKTMGKHSMFKEVILLTRTISSILLIITKTIVRCC